MGMTRITNIVKSTADSFNFRHTVRGSVRNSIEIIRNMNFRTSLKSQGGDAWHDQSESRLSANADGEAWTPAPPPVRPFVLEASEQERSPGKHPLELHCNVTGE